MKSALGYLKTQIALYHLVLRDSRTPKLPKFLLGFAAVYVFFPFATVVVPILVFIALKMIPREIVDDNRGRVKGVHRL